MLATLRHRNFALLWSAGLISETGDWVVVVGLPIYVYLLTGSALQTSGLFVLEQVPAILLGSVAGVFVDRWDRRLTLVTGTTLQGTVLLSLLAVRSPSSLWLVYVVAFTESMISQFMSPALNAILPSLVEDDRLVPANSLAALSANLARLVGAPLGGFVVGFWSLTGVVVLDAISFFVAALMILGISAPTQSAEGGDIRVAGSWTGLWREWREGLTVVARNRVLSVLFGTGGLQQAAQGVFLVLFVIWVLHVLHGGPSGVGWLRGVQAVGGVLGGVVAARLGSSIKPRALQALGALAFGLIELAIWNAPDFVPGLALPTILFILVGIPGAMYGAGLLSMLQVSTDDRYRGRVFGAFGSTYAILQTAGMASAGILADRVNLLAILDVQAGIYIVTGALAFALL